jgi:tetratricopeptide (TPR) repeat protein
VGSGHAMAHNIFSDVAFDRGNCKEAIAVYAQALALNPNYAEAYNNRAYTYMRMQNYAPALQDLDQALRIRPDLKPGNVMLTADGKVKVLRFGEVDRGWRIERCIVEFTKMLTEATVSPSFGTNPGLIPGTANDRSPQRAQRGDLLPYSQ